MLNPFGPDWQFRNVKCWDVYVVLVDEDNGYVATRLTYKEAKEVARNSIRIRNVVGAFVRRALI